MACVTGAGAAVVVGIAVSEGTLYYGVALFLAVFTVIGVAQAVTGLHLVMGAEKR